MKIPAIIVTISDDTYLSLQTHGYCALICENDLIGGAISINQIVDIKTESYLETGGRTMCLVSKQTIGPRTFSHVYKLCKN